MNPKETYQEELERQEKISENRADQKQYDGIEKGKRITKLQIEVLDLLHSLVVVGKLKASIMWHFSNEASVIGVKIDVAKAEIERLKC